MDDGVGGTEEAEQELLAALAPVEENKATDAENPPLQTGPPLYSSIVLKSTNGTLTARFSAVTRNHVTSNSVSRAISSLRANFLDSM